MPQLKRGRHVALSASPYLSLLASKISTRCELRAGAMIEKRYLYSSNTANKRQLVTRERDWTDQRCAGSPMNRKGLSLGKNTVLK